MLARMNFLLIFVSVTTIFLIHKYVSLIESIVLQKTLPSNQRNAGVTQYKKTIS